MKLFYLFLSLCLTISSCFAQTIDISGPPGSQLFGMHTKILPNGNYVITDPYFDDNLTKDVGAVYLFSGGSHTIISVIKGSHANDLVGSGGITVLPNGNFLIVSSNWYESRGALTWVDSNLGLNGIISPENSLVASYQYDNLGGSDNSIKLLSSGNYLISSRHGYLGAITWGNATSGTKGAISSENSLVGNEFGSPGYITYLPNGNFVIHSPTWNESRGAITWVDGTKGIIGEIGIDNSIVGKYKNDQIGFYGVTFLKNGNFVANNILYNNVQSAITWMSGVRKTVGEISESNSLIGGGFFGSAEPLSNGNYVVLKSGGTGNGYSGSVTLCNGETGTSGYISKENSLVDDIFGTLSILPNGNFVVANPGWNSGRGSVTFIDGLIGLTGKITKENSLVGTNINDNVGSNFASLLPNGNYIVQSSAWNGNRGAVTFGDKQKPLIGEVSSENSLVGAYANDLVGLRNTIFLPNGNYLLVSNNGNKGAVTFGNGNIGVTGIVNSTNSLVGNYVNDVIGSSGIQILSNGNYLIKSGQWNNLRGAVTWGSGTLGVTGVVSSSNSITGANPNDYVGNYNVTALENGHYVIPSMNWNSYRGAVTFGNGIVGSSGIVSSENSLVGTNSGDEVGSGGITDLKNDYFLVISEKWNNNRGAVTKSGTSSRAVGLITVENSFVGANTNDAVGSGGISVLPNGNFLIKSLQWNTNRGAVTWGNSLGEIKGNVTKNNSLVGFYENDQIGSSGIKIMPNGNYLVGSWYYNQRRGSLTWGNSLTGITGEVDESNSLIGANENDNIGTASYGNEGITFLSNGNYLVTSSDFNNKRGAITWGSGITGVSGVVSASNSLVGTYDNDQLGHFGYEYNAVKILSNGTIIIPSTNWNKYKGAITIGNISSGIIGEVNSCNSVIATNVNSEYLNFDYNAKYDYVLVGRRYDNIVSIFNQTNIPLANNLDEASLTINGNTLIPIISKSGCRIIASIIPNGTIPVTGAVQAKTWIETEIPVLGNNPFVARHYQITPKNNGTISTGKITLYFTQTEFDQFNINPLSILNLPSNPDDVSGKKNLKISQYHGDSNIGTGLPGSYPGNEIVIDPADNDVLWNPNRNRWEVSFNVSGFSNFLVHTSMPALPLSLISFKATLEESTTYLSWKTVDEINTKEFIIESSKDAKNFSAIGAVNSQNNLGTHRYSFSDPDVFNAGAKNVYYRLKMIDIDGSFAYSGIAQIKIEPKMKVLIYPNPVSNIANFNFTVSENENVVIKVINNSGVVIKEELFLVTPTNNIAVLKLSEIPDGTYIIDIKGESFSAGKQFIKM